MAKSTSACPDCNGDGFTPSCGGTCPGPGHSVNAGCLPVFCDPCNGTGDQ
jgi:hypothetical protein